MKILIACSSGGHLAQALALKPWWGDHDRLWVTGPTPDARMKLKGEQAIACHWPTQRSIPKLLRNARLARRVLRDYRPDVVFSTGAAIAVPFMWQAHSVGARSIYLETTGLHLQTVVERASRLPRRRRVPHPMGAARRASASLQARGAGPVSDVFTVVASVGTYHHPFDRFVEWLEPWTMRNRAQVVFQHGSTRPMRGSENHEMLSPKELLEQYRAADAIVLQGGAGGVMDARKAGRIPIVVPRIPIGQEVVDDHQVILCRRLADLGVVHVAESAEDLARLLDGTRSGTVSSRLSKRRSTPGVREAVRLLASGHDPTAYRIERGEVRLRPRLRRRTSVQHTSAAPRAPRRARLPPRVRGGPAPGRPDPALDSVRGPCDWGRRRLAGHQLRGPAGLRTRAILQTGAVVRRPPRRGSGVRAAHGCGDIRAAPTQPGCWPRVRCTCSRLTSVGFRLAFRRTPTVLVGNEASVRRLATRWQERSDVKIVATCAWRGSKPDIPDGSLSELIPQVLGAAERNHARSVVITSEMSLATSMLRDLAWAASTRWRRVHGAGRRQREGRQHQDSPAGRPGGAFDAPAVRAPGLDRGEGSHRPVVAAVALLVLVPILVVVALWLRLTTKHPAVLRQARTGRDGETYAMYTFRTVVASRERTPGSPGWATSCAGPPSTSFRGWSTCSRETCRSWVRGRRLRSETVRYTDRMWRRLSVRPGVTGLSQVSGRSRLSPEETISIDLQYIDHWNLRLDARILARTLGVALSRDVTR